MTKPFSEQLYQIADSMGVSLYQRFNLADGAVFLRCPVAELKKLAGEGKINSIQVSGSDFEFFGFQLLEHLLGSITGGVLPTPESPSSDRILRAKEVWEMIGVSRTTLWRMERKGDFPSRVPLGPGSVGWLLSDVEHWMRTRKRA